MNGREYSTPRGLRGAFLRGIGAGAAAVVIRPGQTLFNHPLPEVFIIQEDPRQQATIVVLTPAQHGNVLAQCPLPERIARCDTVRLTNLWRIDAVQANADRFAAIVGAHMDGVAVDHIAHKTPPRELQWRRRAGRRAPGQQRGKGEPDQHCCAVSQIHILRLLQF